jgi:CPA2 family monovalent cation:H+ antiporter-2
MHDLPLITTIASAFTAAWLLGLLAHRVGLSPIVGYLVAGMIVGPHTPGFEANLDIAQQLAEVGVILLMFDVGLHFSLKELLAVKSVAIPGAVGQSLVATALGMFVFAEFGFSNQSGMVMGMAMAVASTVVLMRVLMDARALNSPQGHVAVGWLLVEDIFTVVVLVLIPVLGKGGGKLEGTELALSLGGALIKLSILVAVILVAGARVIPWFLQRVARLRSRELFTLTVLVFSIAIAAASYYIFGASMALGAFLAGMVVAQSPLSHQAAADALPMRDTFAVLFFVSVGMLFDPSFILESPGMILAGLVIVMLVKPLTALVIVAALGHSARTALTVAIGLAQIGEFSFVLAELARHNGLMPEAGQNTLIGTAILSISLNPMLFRSIPALERRLAGVPWLWRLLNARSERKAIATNADAEHRVSEIQHSGKRLAIVVGYGPVGRSVDQLLREADLDTVIIELNLDTVDELTREGRIAIYGDASRQAILKHAGVEQASHLVVTLPQAPLRAAVVATARTMNEQLRILVRAHYLTEREELEHAGATAAVFEEGEAALALARLVLADTGASPEAVDRSLQDLRLRLILENVTHLDTRRIRNIMIPWTRVSRLSVGDSLKEVRRKVAEQRYSRWPVVAQGSVRPIGYLLTKDLISETAAGDGDWSGLVRPLAAVGPDDDIESTLRFMQREGESICIVEGNGAPLGLVTLEDILEQVVGRIEDEYPRELEYGLAELLAAGGIVPELTARTADDAIAELAAAIGPNQVPDEVDIEALAVAREHQLSTHVGFGVAIPHATCPLLTSPLVVFGRSSQGIVFSGEASEPVYFVFLLVTPAERPDLHVHLLGRVASAASKAEVRERLRDAVTAEEILDILSASEDAKSSASIG